MSEKGFVEFDTDNYVSLTEAGRVAYDELVTWLGLLNEPTEWWGRWDMNPSTQWVQ